MTFFRPIRLQDVLSTKRKLLRETETEFKSKVPLLRDENEKLKQDIKRHEKKTERFVEIQEKTYKGLWKFAHQQIADHLERVTVFVLSKKKIEQLAFKTL